MIRSAVRRARGQSDIVPMVAVALAILLFTVVVGVTMFAEVDRQVCEERVGLDVVAVNQLDNESIECVYEDKTVTIKEPFAEVSGSIATPWGAS